MASGNSDGAASSAGGGDLSPCDLIMKGGITSGVVYPEAITTIAKKYRLRGIGGTSAGAIGAVIAAAAEYSRHSGRKFEGFSQINRIPNDFQQNLAGLFQPSPELEKPFNLMMRAVEAKGGQSKMRALARGIVREYATHFIIAAVVALVAIILLIAHLAPGGGARWLMSLVAVLGGALIGLVPVLALVFSSLYRSVTKDLPARFFGLCTGKTQPGHSEPAFTDWMHAKIETVAGDAEARGRPLTIRDLRAAGIDLASMTTDLSSHRPYQLPLRTSTHYFSESEFRTLLPDDVVDYLVAKSRDESGKDRSDPIPNEYGLDDFYQLPVGDDFPVLLVARMSLSFPGLIAAIPLYRFDYTLRDGEQLRRCIFSDGGISSNFPIHFFDAFLPSCPTFGITLGVYEEERHGDERVRLPDAPTQSGNLAVDRVDSIPGFLMSILNTAKDWQDTLQSRLPGYSERIVQIRLSPQEGGLNLDMDEQAIGNIVGYGRSAGETVLEEFDFDEHRYRRAISFLPELERGLGGLSRRFGPDGAYSGLLRDHEAKRYDLGKTWQRETLEPFARKLADLGEAAARGEPQLSHRNLPHIDADIRLVASADRVPKHESPQAPNADAHIT